MMTKSKAHIRYILRLLAITGAVFLFFAGTPQVAHAHNSYDSSIPSDGEVLTTAPATWTVTFAKSVPVGSASGEVVTADGVRSALAPPRQGATDKEIVFDLPANLSGDITARWRLIGVDGHVVSGRVPFSVRSEAFPNSTAPITTPTQETAPTLTETPAPVAVPVAITDDENIAVPEPLRVALRLANYGALILLGGILFIEYSLVQGSVTTFAARRILRASSVAIAVVPILSFFILLNDVRGTGESLTSAFSTTLSLTAGLMHLSRLVVGVLIAGFMYLALQRGEMTQHFLQRIGGLFAVYCLTLAYVGHSRSEALPLIGIPTDVLHVLAASVWLGGLATLLLVVIPTFNADQGLVAFTRFGKIAERAFIVILVTGIIQSLRLHGGVTSLFSSAHGVLLLLKIALVLLMVKFASKNRKRLITRALRNSSQSATTKAQLVRASVAEAGAGIAVIAVTAALVGASLG